MNKRSFEIWNIWTKEETCRVLKNLLRSFGPISNLISDKSNKSGAFF